MGTLGAIGLTTGCDAFHDAGLRRRLAGPITGDNITAYHLINIKRLAYETFTPPLGALQPGEAPSGAAPEEIENVVRQVVRICSLY